MEELSIAEKAMRYDVAVKKAKSKITGDKDHILYEDDVIEMFPELKESEGERIRNEIISAIEEDWPGRTDWIVWLKMQVEQKPAVIIPNFRVGDVIRVKGSNAEYRITEISDGYYRGHGWRLDIIEGDKCGDYELVEQKPTAWSEEDDLQMQAIIDLLPGLTIRHNWLKSLKGRVQPKVELTQLDKNILEAAIAFVEQNNHFYCWRGVDKHTVLSALHLLRLQNTWKPSELPHWKKSTLPNDNTTGFNSDYFCHNGYYINYKELFEKLPKED